MTLDRISINSTFNYSSLDISNLDNSRLIAEAKALRELSDARRAFEKYDIKNPTDEKISIFMQGLKRSSFSSNQEEKIWTFYIRYVRALNQYSTQIEANIQPANPEPSKWKIVQLLLAVVAKVQLYLARASSETLQKGRQEYYLSLEKYAVQEQRAVELFARYFELEKPLKTTEEIDYFFHLMAFTNEPDLAEKIFDQKHKYLKALEKDKINIDVIFRQELRHPSAPYIKSKQEAEAVIPNIEEGKAESQPSYRASIQDDYDSDDEDEYFDCAETEEMLNLFCNDELYFIEQEKLPSESDIQEVAKENEDDMNILILESYMSSVFLNNDHLLSIMLTNLFPKERIDSVTTVAERGSKVHMRVNFKTPLYGNAAQVGENGWSDMTNARFVAKQTLDFVVDFENKSLVFVNKNGIQVGLWTNDFDPYLKDLPWVMRKSIQAALSFGGYSSKGLETTANLVGMQAVDKKINLCLSINGEHTVPQEKGKVISPMLLKLAENKTLVKDFTPEELAATFEHFSWQPAPL